MSTLNKPNVYNVKILNLMLPLNNKKQSNANFKYSSFYKVDIQ